MTQKRVKASDVIGNSYYIYTLQSSNNTPSLNSTITITCNVTDVYGQAISGKSITLYQNNTSQGTKTTDSNGNAGWSSISMGSAGLQTFQVENSKIEIFVDNKSDVGHTHSQYLTEHQSLSNYVTTDDSRLSDSRTPTSHVHGNLQNNGQVGSTVQANKNVVTNSSGLITTEDKPTIPSASSTTPSADTTSGSIGTGTTWARADHTHPKSSLYSESSHNHTKSQITDFPSIPSKTSDLQNDSGFLTSHQDISGKIDTAGTGLSKSGTTLNHSNSVTALTTASLKKVKYDAQGHITEASDVNGSDLPSHTHNYSTFSGSYSDLTNKPSYTATITSSSTGAYKIGSINISGSSVDIYGKDTNTEYSHPTYSNVAKSTSALYKIKTNSLGHIIEIAEATSTDIASLGVEITDTIYTHPSYTSKSSGLYKITVDSIGHISATASVSANDLPTHTHTKSQITDFPSIPSKTSELTNDSGFLTSHQDISGKENTSNKVTSISSSSTDTQYPSAKLVYNQLSTKAPTSHASTETTYGVSNASNYGHSMASSTSPQMNGTAAVGSETAKFARGDHVHPTDTSRAPIGHASTANTYGLGSTSNYGHVKTINNLTQSSHSDGTALSAYQGKILNDTKADKSQVVDWDNIVFVDKTDDDTGAIILNFLE